MKALIFALLLLPGAAAFPATDFDGTLTGSFLEPTTIHLNGVEAWNGTGNASIQVSDGAYAWRINENGTVTHGNVTVLDVAAVVAAAVEGALALVPAPDVDSLEANITAAILENRVTGYATAGDVATLAAELRSQRTTDRAEQDVALASIQEKVSSGRGAEFAVIGLVLVTLGFVLYREWVAWQSREATVEQRRVIRAIALQLGLSEDALAYVEAVADEEPEVITAGRLVE